MNRKALDRLLAAGGLAVAAVLLVAGGLLTWAHTFVHDQLHSQLAAEKIYFTPRGSGALAPKEIGPTSIGTPVSNSPAPRPRPMPITSSPCTCGK